MPSRDAIVFGPGDRQRAELGAARRRLFTMLGVAVAAHGLLFAGLRLGDAWHDPLPQQPLQIHLPPDAPQTVRDEAAEAPRARVSLQVAAPADPEDAPPSELATYIEGWRRRVERVGTRHYPTAAAWRGVAENPVLEVTVARDGTLASAVVRRSSGSGEIDDAALKILRMASPYEAFPPPLAARYPTVRFAHEWQFRGGRLGARTVRVP
jgi:TonB family protein